MSYKPKAFGFFFPTLLVYRPEDADAELPEFHASSSTSAWKFESGALPL